MVQIITIIIIIMSWVIWQLFLMKSQVNELCQDHNYLNDIGPNLIISVTL